MNVKDSSESSSYIYELDQKEKDSNIQLYLIESNYSDISEEK